MSFQTFQGAFSLILAKAALEQIAKTFIGNFAIYYQLRFKACLVSFAFYYF
jgi:hypothetical protein